MVQAAVGLCVGPQLPGSVGGVGAVEAVGPKRVRTVVVGGMGVGQAAVGRWVGHRSNGCRAAQLHEGWKLPLTPPGTRCHMTSLPPHTQVSRMRPGDRVVPIEHGQGTWRSHGVFNVRRLGGTGLGWAIADCIGLGCCCLS